MTKLEATYAYFERALVRFEEVMEETKTDIVRDSAIKRFELVFETAWRVIKAFLEEHHGVVCVSPKTCFQEAYQKKLIEFSEEWMRIADDRNYTIHTYKETFAEKIYADLPLALRAFQSLKKAFIKQGIKKLS